MWGLTGSYLLVCTVPFGQQVRGQVSFCLRARLKYEFHCWCWVLIYLKSCQGLWELMTSFSMDICGLADSSLLLTSGNLLISSLLTALAYRLGFLGLLQLLLATLESLLSGCRSQVLTQAGPADQLHFIVICTLCWNHEWLSMIKQGCLHHLKIKKSIFQRSDFQIRDL